MVDSEPTALGTGGTILFILIVIFLYFAWKDNNGKEV